MMKTLAIALIAGSAATASGQVSFIQVNQIDAGALGLSNLGSVTAHGDKLYAGTLFGAGQVWEITDQFGTPGAVAVGPGNTTGGGNGFVSLDTDGTTLVAATNNGGGADIVQVFDAATNGLNWSSDATTLPGLTRIDGAAVDPISGNVLLTGFGNGNQNLFDPASPTPVGTMPTIIFDGGAGNVSTGFRDVSYDDATGDLYLRAVNGVGRGIRVGDDDYQDLSGTAGIDTIRQDADGFNSAINVEFVPVPGGDNIAIYNLRNGANTFGDQVRVTGVDGLNIDIAASFFAADGVTPFAVGDASSGIYDFSYNPVNGLLYVSDFSDGTITAFQVIPAPASAALLGLGGLAAARRRR
jgi:hypothetical protein